MARLPQRQRSPCVAAVTEPVKRAAAAAPTAAGRCAEWAGFVAHLGGAGAPAPTLPSICCSVSISTLWSAGTSHGFHSASASQWRIYVSRAQLATSAGTFLGFHSAAQETAALQATRQTCGVPMRQRTAAKSVCGRHVHTSSLQPHTQQPTKQWKAQPRAHKSRTRHLGDERQLLPAQLDVRLQLPPQQLLHL